MLLAVARAAAELLATAAILHTVERLRPSARGQRLLRGGVGTDLIHQLVDPVVVRASVALAGTGAVAIVMLFGDPNRALGAVVQAWPLGVQVLVGSLLTDLAGYWRHRLTHTRALWPAHAVHHSSVELDWLSTNRFHPIDQIITAFVQIFVLWALGFSQAAIALCATVRGLYGMFIHANVRLGYGPLDFVFVSPRQHRWHHSADPAARDKNFSTLFSIWDVVFGTFYNPRGREPTELGLGDERLPNNYLVHLGYPFVKWFGGKL
jgi:sterol desaturase/sphingolipid hydroxylase (fatty acid hydroxylase superfamily)